MSAVVATTSSSSTTAQILTNSGNYSQSMDEGKKPFLTAPEKDEHENKTRDPLSADLRKILSEVARTGVCLSLPWNQGHQENHGAASLHPQAAPPVATTKHSSRISGKFSNHQRTSASSPFGNSPSFQSTSASRKPHRNGIHLKRRRLSSDSASNSRVFLIRTSSSASASSSLFSHPSAGNGRNSGSEVEDSTQYECDSEGTSATSASERSVDRREQRRKLASIQSSRLRPEQQAPVVYKSLKDVIRTALELVLDHWHNSFGYTLTSAEKRIKLNLGSQNAITETEPLSLNDKESSNALAVFQHRRNRLLALLQGPLDSHMTGDSTHGVTTIKSPLTVDEGPPFTIQRIAEVLIAPEKYYTKTHKLCNSLEKLLLVTSSSNAFGGSSGGDLGHSSLEDLEAANRADEQENEVSSNRLNSWLSSTPIEGTVPVDAGEGVSSISSRETLGSREETIDGTSQVGHLKSSETHTDSPGPCLSPVREMSPEEMREEEAARLALRTKFDHSGIDQSLNRDVRSIAKNRGLTGSPPPPVHSNAMTDVAQNFAAVVAAAGHGGVRQKKQQIRPERHSPPSSSNVMTAARSPSPILFTPTMGTDGTASSQSISSPAQNSNHPLSHVHANLHAYGPQVSDTAAGGVAGANSELGNHSNTGSPTADSADQEGDTGCFSASNSDVDSESDDISLDDSASDRSDGSDSGSAAATSLLFPSSLHEPFTAARVMALSRMHQQQQLQRGLLYQQSRNMMNSALNSNTGSLLSSGDVVRHQAEVGYHSGDSIDSMIAEDSGGSDSSSSDFAD